MKKLFALISFCMLIWSACKKESKPEAEDVNTFHAKKNGEVWNTSGGVLLYNNNFVIHASKPINQLSESVFIDFKTSDIRETGYVTTFNATFTYILGGDQGIASYKASETQNNFLKITKIDTLNRTIEGQFDIEFLKTSDTSSAFENQIVLNHGKFNIPYHKEK